MRRSLVRKCTFAAALLVGLALTFPAAAEPEAVQALALTPRRAGASVASLIGIAGLVSAGLALSRGAAAGRRPRSIAITAGLVSAAAGALVIASAQGGFGTGQGLAGGIVALILGLLSLGLAGLARRRAQRAH